MSEAAPDYAALMSRARREIRRLRERVQELDRSSTEPIAVVGIGCRLPGRAHDPDSFWRLVAEGRDAVCEVPASRWDLDRLFDPDPSAVGKTYTRDGGFIDAPEGFDAEFFGISPREAALMDPQQRIFLEVAFEAFDDAGCGGEDLRGSATGVYAGVCGMDYALLQVGAETAMEAHCVTGCAQSMMANRVSFTLDLRGPSVSLDTACSSSLVAVHLACESLRRAECELALAGGVNLLLTPEPTIAFSRWGALAPDGRCKAFDARADGFVRGEGCGAVVLRRLGDALERGDRIWAVIRGSAVNQDGRTTGLTAPNGVAQQAVIRAALERSSVDASELGYVEAHGTGTPLGDPIEVEALAEVLAARDSRAPRCRLGSLKANVGHLEAAAGVAGLIKAALVLHHREIPPQLHFDEPNPHLRELLGGDAESAGAFEIPTRLEAWPSPPGVPRRAGVSSFAFGGTNAHVVLEQAPEPQAVSSPAPGPWLLPVSGRGAAAARANAARLGEWLVERVESVALADVAHTAGTRRSAHRSRVAVVAADAAQAAERLAQAAQGHAAAGVRAGDVTGGLRRRVVFVFPGQGCQWPGMGRELYRRSAAFRDAMQACDAALRAAGAAPVLEPVLQRAPWEGVATIQPAVFALEVSLAAWWRSLGLEPAAVVGHSLGEVAAAVVAGALTVEDGARVVTERSRRVAAQERVGAMAMVELTATQAAKAIAPYGEALALAAHNGPRSSVVSGEPAAVEALLEALARDEVFCRRVDVEYASHTEHMDALLPGLRAGLTGLSPRPARVPFHSTVTGGVLDGTALDGDYWARNLREPVRLWPVVASLLEAGGAAAPLCIEVSPHPVLLGSLGEGLAAAQAPCVASLRRDQPEWETLLDQVGAAWCAGATPRLAALEAERGQVVSLPTYAWQHEAYWIEEPREGRSESGRGEPAGGWLLRHVESSREPGVHCFETELGLESHPYLTDHRVGSTPVLPAAAYLTLADAAARRLFGEGSHAIAELALERPLPVPEQGTRPVQLVVEPSRGSRARFTVRTPAAEQGTSEPWPVHARGVLARAPADDDTAASFELETLRSRCPEPVSAEVHYRALAARGLHYGPSFRRITGIERGTGEALGRLGETEEAGAAGGADVACLDAIFQIAASVSKRDARATYLPSGVGGYRRRGPPAAARWAHARLTEAPGVDEVSADVVAVDGRGRPVVEVTGLRARRISHEPVSALAGRCYELAWRRVDGALPETAEDPEAVDHWVVFGAPDLGTELADALRVTGSCTEVRAGPAYEWSDSERITLDPDRDEDFARLLAEPGLGRGRLGIVFLWPLAAFDPAELPGPRVLALCDRLVRLVRAAAAVRWAEEPRIWLVTRGAQAVRPDEGVSDPAASALWGLGRTVELEHGELRLTSVDLDPRERGGLAPLADEVRRPWAGEREIALRAGARSVARVVPTHPSVADAEAPAGERPHRLEIERPGSFAYLALRESADPELAPGEVRIRVEAAGLNFRDVLVALGVVPPLGDLGFPLGGECSGVVECVGDGVTGFAVGDEVVAIAAGCFATHATTRETLCWRKPTAVSFESAAAVPMVYGTASLALETLARVSHGETLLVHAASGGVGCAARALARALGAEVLATAGSDEKRSYLRECGVAHVFDSRSLDFVDPCLEATGGRGVDVVLSSLTGDALEANLEVLAPGGRFIEIGEQAIRAGYRLPLEPFAKGLAFHSLDFGHWIAERPEAVSRVLESVLRRIGAGALDLPPVEAHALAQAADAFHAVARGRHIGKRVLVPGGPETPIRAARRSATRFRPDGCYVVVGGTGGLGRRVAGALARHGARHVGLVSRSGLGARGEAILAELRDAGAEAVDVRADVSCADSIAAALEELRARCGPIRGVVHAGGVIDDAALVAHDRDRIARVLAPKVDGAFHLHELTRGDPLEHFVLFSSAAALLGSPGQAGYSAANAYLAGLAGARRAAGLPALCIDWGAWSEEGLAADLGDALRGRGIESLAPEEGIAAFLALLDASTAHVGVVDLVPETWRQVYPGAASSPYFSELFDASGGEAGAARARLALEALGTSVERRAWLQAHVKEQIAEVLRLDSAEIGLKQPISDLGFDSLMALELRNRLESSLGVRLSSTLLFNYPHLEALVPYLAQRAGVGLEAPEDDDPAASEPAPESELARRLRTLDDAESERLLEEALDSLGG